MTLGVAFCFGATAQAAPQYDLDCEACHTMPPLDSASGQRLPASGATKGNHQSHADASPASCIKCHGAEALSYPTDHRSKSIQVQGNINGSPAGAYSRAFFNQTSVPPVPLGNCSNVNCHFERSTPAWGSALFVNVTDCNQCHGAAPSAGHPTAISKHGIYYGTDAGSCVKCHPNHSAEAKPFAHATSVTSRGISVRFTAAPNSGGSYSGPTNDFLPSQSNSFGTCSGIYCHSDGRSLTGPYTVNSVPGWGGGSIGCNGCHGGPASLGSPIATGRHQAHVNNSATLGTSYVCADCHAKTASGDAAIATVANHVNAFVDYSGVRAGNSASYSAGSCSASYCHSSGKQGKPGMVASVEPSVPSWSGAALGCNGCHGAQSTPTAGVSFNSVAGEPNYLNGGAGTPSANSHEKHVGAAGAATCANCHSKTTVSGSTIIAGSQHTDTFANYTAGNGKNFGKVADKSCSNVSCHGGNGVLTSIATAQWGATLNCNGCHGGPAALGTNILDSGKHTQHVNQAGVIGDNLGCAECHAKTVSSNTVISDSAKHMNFFADYSGVRAGNSSTLVGGSCSATYCHSSGKKGQAGMVATVEPALPSWSGAALGCNGCHGARLTPTAGVAFNSVAGEPNYLNGGAGAENANSHQTHVGAEGAASCANCHSKTTVSGITIIAGSQHLNALSNYTSGNGKSFGKLANKTCSNVSCHSGNGMIAGVPEAQWGATLNCNGCHGGPVALGSNILASGKHAAHMNNATLLGANYGCVECHAKTVSSDSAISDSIRHGNAFADYSGVRAGKSSTYSGGTCSATYCHSSGKKGLSGMVAIVEPASPSWSGAALGCKGCHGAQSTPTAGVSFNSVAGEPNYLNGGSGANNANSHQKHVKTDGSSTCVYCHSGTVDASGSALVGNHTNKSIEVANGGGKSFGYPGSKTCSNVSCHSGGLFTSANATWGANLDCKGCHATLSSGHTRHVGSAWNSLPFYNYTANDSSGADTDGVTWRNYSFGCANCHPVTLASHMNGSIEVENGQVAGGSVLRNMNTASALVGSIGSGTVRCSNVYCHFNVTTPQWNQTFTAATRCSGCHGNAPTGDSHTAHAVGIHYDDIFSGTSGLLPAAGGVGVNAGHGDPAQSTTIGCNICHYDTVTNARNKYNSSCSTVACHGNATGINADATGAARIGNLALHVNGSNNVAFPPSTIIKSKAQLALPAFNSYTAGVAGWSYTGRVYKNGTASSYDRSKNNLTVGSYVGGSCSNISCHNGKTAKWVDDFGAARDCVMCHTN